MIQRALQLGLFLPLFVAGALSAQDRLDRHAAELDSYVEEAREAWQVPGVAVAVVQGDEVVYARGFGHLRSDRPTLVDEHSLFAIGSSSKAFTAAALAHLVDEGRVGWDDPVVDHLPSFRLPDPYLTRQITLRDLIAHRTGVRAAGLLWTGSGFSREEIVHRLRHKERTIGFRSRFLYNNEMYVVAGEVVRAVSGLSWDDFLRERLFEPMGMTRTNTSVDDLRGDPNVAMPHVLGDDGMTPVEYRHIDNVGPAGSINSSAVEMAQWVRLHLAAGVHGDRRILEERTVDELHASQFLWSGPGWGLETRFSSYGLGWFLYDFRGRKVVEHGGAIDGMHALVGMIPEEDIGVVVLTNRLGHRLPYALMYHMFDVHLGEPHADWSGTMKALADEATERAAHRRRAQAEEDESSSAPAASPLPLEAYAGEYESTLYGAANVSVESGRLVLERADSAADLEPDRAHIFRAAWHSPGMASVLGRTEVRFHLGPLGEPDRLELAGLAEFRRVSSP